MSWDQIIAMREEAKQLRRADAQRPLVACPIDGMLLVIKDGIRNCPMGNFRTTRTTSGR